MIEESQVDYTQTLCYATDLASLFRADRTRDLEMTSARLLLGTVLSSVPDGLVVLDDSYVIQQANPGFARLVGLPPDQLIGMGLVNVLPVENLLSSLHDAARQPTGSATWEVSMIQPSQVVSDQNTTVVFDRRSFLLSIFRLEGGCEPGWVMVLHDLTEQKRMHDAFGCYVPPDLAEQISRRGSRLGGGTTLTGSVLYTDIRNFTTLSEQIAAPEVVTLLNHYYTQIGQVIQAEAGWICGFGGDSLLAVFGALQPLPNHAIHATRAALAVRDVLASFNAQQRAFKEPELCIGMGISAGEMVAGTIGSPDRMEYTVIGDTVNRAARIEELNKQWDTDILIDQQVYDMIKNDIATRAMPPTALRGKDGIHLLYALEGAEKNETL